MALSRVILRYHEIALKGGNRPFFESCLREQLKRLFPAKDGFRVRQERDHFWIDFPESFSREEVRRRLGFVFGVAHYYFVESLSWSGVSSDLADRWEPFLERVLPELKREVQTRGGIATEIPFRVEVRRRDKRVPLTSMQLAREIAKRLLPKVPEFKVNLDHPEVILYVDFFYDSIQWYAAKHPGCGGMPVGSSGKVAALLSSGFDSPVAALRMMRRGAKITLVHFHSYPATTQESIDNVRALVEQLTQYQGHSKLFLFPLIEYQKAVLAKAPAAFRTLLYRRMMFRMAERAARYDRAKGLVTGECLAQVASQTLDNLRSVDAVVEMPVYRPLIGMDKVEIIAEAERFGTRMISSRPYEDCCTLYVDRSPALISTAEELEAIEATLDVSGFERAIWEGRSVEVFRAGC